MSQDPSKPLSKLSLNPGASEWKPNMGAKAFVPSFAATPATSKYIYIVCHYLTLIKLKSSCPSQGS